MADLLRCRRCTKLFRPGPYKEQVCPTCGYTGPVIPEEKLGLLEASQGVDGVVGRPRRTSAVVLLSIFTLGLYSLAYLYLAFKELDSQHGRRHPTWLFLWGVLTFPLGIGLVLLIAYNVKELYRLQAYRRVRGLRAGPGSLEFHLWLLLAIVPGFLVALGRVNGSVKSLWQAIYAEQGVRLPLWARTFSGPQRPGPAGPGPVR